MFAVIAIQKLELMLEQGCPFILIDLRTAQEFQDSHLAGAVNIPFDQLEEYPFDAYPGATLVFYCEHGGKSMQAARNFAKMGWNALSLGSGIQYYRGKYLVSRQNFIDRCPGNAIE